MAGGPLSRLSGRPLALLAICVLAVAAVVVAVRLSSPDPAASDPGRAASRPQDALRTNWDSAEAGLSPAAVAGPGFGALFTAHVNGAVLGQPLVVGQTVIVATESDSVYGLSGSTGATRWSVSLGRPVPNARLVCAVIGPTAGVTGSPVYDPRTGRVYLVAEIQGSGGRPEFWMFGISAQAGSIVWRAPVRGGPANDPGEQFSARGELQRPGLLLMNGWVYAAFGPRCEGTVPYGGYVVGVNTRTRALTMWTDDTRTSNGQAGIWQGGTGLMSDGPGRILLATSNGISPPPGPGTAPPGDLAESLVELAVQPGGRLVTRDFYSPPDAPTLDSYDLDFGSGGPVGLPFGTPRFPRLVLVAGKVGQLTVLNGDHLGGRVASPGPAGGVVATAGPFGGLFGHVAVFGGGSGADYVYYVGQSDYLRALRVSTTGPVPVLSDVADSGVTFGVSSSSPVVTSAGRDLGSAVVWEVNDSGVSSELEAFSAAPQAVGDGLALKQIWSAPVGLPSHFAPPATANGRVYLGTELGQVYGFGTATRAPLATAPVSFGQVAAGSAARAVATITARARITIYSASTASTAIDDPFATGTPRRGGAAVQLPVTLARGQRLAIPVTFTPAGPGGATGSASLTTSAPGFPEVSFSMTGTGTRPGLYSPASSVQFLSTFAGLPRSATVDIVNGGTTSATVSAATAPTGPFSLRGLPAAGTVLRAGQSIGVQVTFAPAHPGPARSAFTITPAHGSPVTEFLTGTAIAGDAGLTAAPAAVSFGQVALGRTVTRTVRLRDPGQQPVTIMAASGPAAPFRAVGAARAGQSLGPSDAILVQVAFTPRQAGLATATIGVRYLPVGSGRPGTVTIALSGTAVSPP
jgi:hypothetical protein